MSYFLDIADLSLKKYGESLCGDKIKTVVMEDKTVVVLSDGLGSGVKANILATLTAEIIIKMLCANINMSEVVETVIHTLPVCQVRKIAYSTFIVMEIRHSDYAYKIMNFDSPETMFFRNGRLLEQQKQTFKIQGRDIQVLTGNLTAGDFVTMVSDGILHAGLGVKMNFGWGRDNVADYIMGDFSRSPQRAWDIAHSVLTKTHSLYGGKPGDDASIVVVGVRPRSRLVVFTGPPLDRESQPGIVKDFMAQHGRKVVCGGTTANIVAECLDSSVDVEMDTLTEKIPPIGTLPDIDLVTEGIITMSESLRLLKSCRIDTSKLPDERNGAVLLAKELLSADTIDFMVGQCVNEFYQNPCLPKDISVRKSLIKEIVSLLVDYGKQVSVKYY